MHHLFNILSNLGDKWLLLFPCSKRGEQSLKRWSKLSRATECTCQILLYNKPCSNCLGQQPLFLFEICSNQGGFSWAVPLLVSLTRLRSPASSHSPFLTQQQANGCAHDGLSVPKERTSHSVQELVRLLLCHKANDMAKPDAMSKDMNSTYWLGRAVERFGPVTWGGAVERFGLLLKIHHSKWQSQVLNTDLKALVASSDSIVPLKTGSP